MKLPDKPKKKFSDFLQDINSTLWSFVTLAITTLGSVSFLLGKYTSDTNNVELRFEVSALSEKILNITADYDSLSKRFATVKKREETLLASLPVKNEEVFFVAMNIPKLLPDLDLSVELEKLQSNKHGDYAVIRIKNKEGKKIYSADLLQSTGELIPHIGILSYPSKSDSSMTKHQHLFPSENMKTESLGVVLKIESF